MNVTNKFKGKNTDHFVSEPWPLREHELLELQQTTDPVFALEIQSPQILDHFLVVLCLVLRQNLVLPHSNL